ncbi:MAG: NUDIX domain-containing protein, partial [bacterium]|nr:NUDIX domain-containing protein [bacterium]
MLPIAKIKYGKWKTKYKGVIFSIKQRLVSFPDGTQKTFEYSFRDNSVVILPFDEKGRLLLIYEFRMHPDKYVHFLPAGRMDKKGETPRDAA